jgi:predicted  nucleic acid-binding Zn-ribbon protein
MKVFGAQGVALLLLIATSLTFSAESAVSQTGGTVPTAAEVTELQKALDKSRAEAELIETRNQRLAERRQSLEKRIADLREQLLQQEQSLQPAASSTPAAPVQEEQEQVLSGEEAAAAPQAQK